MSLISCTQKYICVYAVSSQVLAISSACAINWEETQTFPVCLSTAEAKQYFDLSVNTRRKEIEKSVVFFFISLFTN